MSDIKKLQENIVKFRDEREWKQFHNPKDMALSLVLEATEVMEHFQWKNKEEMQEHVKKNKDAIGEELADTLNWILLMCHDMGIDIVKATENKLQKNSDKYPVAKSKGSSKKYTELL